MQVIVKLHHLYHIELIGLEPFSRINLDVIVFDKALFFPESKIVTFVINSVSCGFYNDVLNPNTSLICNKTVGKRRILDKRSIRGVYFHHPVYLYILERIFDIVIHKNFYLIN